MCSRLCFSDCRYAIWPILLLLCSLVPDSARIYQHVNIPNSIQQTPTHILRSELSLPLPLSTCLCPIPIRQTPFIPCPRLRRPRLRRPLHLEYLPKTTS